MTVRLVAARSGKGFEYDIRFVWPEGGKLRERGKCPLSGKDACRRWAEARERAVLAAGKGAYRPLRAKEGGGVAPAGAAAGNTTFGAFWPRVVTDHYKANRKKASTTDAAESICKNHLTFLADRPLETIDDGVIAEIKGRLGDAKPKTVNNVLSVLSRALRCAVKWRVLDACPVHDFGLLKVEEEEMSWYELHEYRRLIAGADKCGWLELVVCLLGGSAGLRRGEIRALRWSDVDFERKQLTVRKALWRGVEDMPKGNRGRVVPMTDELVAALRGIRPITGLSARVVGHESLSNRQVRNLMTRVQKRAGLESNGGIHILRHTFCSHLAIAGVTPKAIQELAGHADLKTTMKYMHLAPGHKAAAIQTLERSYSSGEQPEALRGVG